MSVIQTVLFWLFVVCLAYILLLGYGELFRLAASLLRLAGYEDRAFKPGCGRKVQHQSFAPVTVILPQCQKAKDPVAYVKHHLKLDYPQCEVVAVCGGKNNAALSQLQSAYNLVKIDQPIRRVVPMGVVRGIYRSPEYPDLVVVEKSDGSRADDLNCGVNVSRYPVIATTSPWRWLQGQSLWVLARPFMLQYETLAVGGLPRMQRSESGFFAPMQQNFLLKEYPAGIAVPGQKRLPLVAEGYGSFRKQSVIALGGFSKNAGELAMTAQLFSRQGKGGSAIQMLPDAPWEILPWKGFSGLWHHCRALQKDLQSALWNCRGMWFRKKYGRTGLLDVPLHLLVDVAGPILEVAGMALSIALFGSGVIPVYLFAAFWGAQVLFSILNGLAAILSLQVEENEKFTMTRLIRHISCAILYPLGFRQLVAVLRAAAVFAPGR